MPDFLHRRASHLIDEAKGLDAAGQAREACRRLVAAAELLERSFGRGHRDLPELFQLLSDLHHGLGEPAEAERFQTRAWELRHLRARRSRRLLAVSRLDPAFAAPDLDGWPATAHGLVERLRGDDLLEAAPEVLVFGPSQSGKTRLLHVLGHEAIERPWPARLYQGYELFEALATARRVLGVRRQLARLDRFAVLLVDELDPWHLTRGEAELFHTLLLHRRNRRSTVLATRTDRRLDPETFLERVRHTRALRYPSPTAVLVGLDRRDGER